MLIKINLLQFLLLSVNIFAQEINPYRFIATLEFDGKDWGDLGESNFPVTYSFNTSQDANNDSLINIEDNLENIVIYSIGDSIYGTGRTGLTGRGPNYQRPIVYFHIVQRPDYDVYEYWLYYADNNWINDHEHDWEKYFVYVQDTTPYFLLISSHDADNIYPWSEVTTNNNHPVIGVDGGSHAMKLSPEDGVSIRYNGEINKNNGTLNTPEGISLPWQIHSNDPALINTSPFVEYPDTFYYGDPYYLTNSNEWGDARIAPWLRSEWNSPPAVNIPASTDLDILKTKKSAFFPNPFQISSSYNLTPYKTWQEPVSLAIYNILGNMKIYIENIQSDKIIITREDLTSGIYYYIINNHNHTLDKGIIIIQ